MPRPRPKPPAALTDPLDAMLRDVERRPGLSAPLRQWLLDLRAGERASGVIRRPEPARAPPAKG